MRGRAARRPRWCGSAPRDRCRRDRDVPLQRVVQRLRPIARGPQRLRRHQRTAVVVASDGEEAIVGAVEGHGISIQSDDVTLCASARAVKERQAAKASAPIRPIPIMLLSSSGGSVRSEDARSASTRDDAPLSQRGRNHATIRDRARGVLRGTAWVARPETRRADYLGRPGGGLFT